MCVNHISWTPFQNATLLWIPLSDTALEHYLSRTSVSDRFLKTISDTFLWTISLTLLWNTISRIFSSSNIGWEQEHHPATPSWNPTNGSTNWDFILKHKQLFCSICSKYKALICQVISWVVWHSPLIKHELRKAKSNFRTISLTLKHQRVNSPK